MICESKLQSRPEALPSNSPGPARGRSSNANPTPEGWPSEIIKPSRGINFKVILFRISAKLDNRLEVNPSRVAYVMWCFLPGAIPGLLEVNPSRVGITAHRIMRAMNLLRPFRALRPGGGHCLRFHRRLLILSHIHDFSVKPLAGLQVIQDRYRGKRATSLR